jgi:hypothetical protein
MRQLMEREARTIALINSNSARMDEGFTRIREDHADVRRDLTEIRGD